MIEALLRAAAAVRAAEGLLPLAPIVPEVVEAIYASYYTHTPTLADYCPGFADATSDGIVPLESALYGAPKRTIVEGVWHLQLNRSAEVAHRIAAELLYDRPGVANADLFNRGFPSGQPWPFECR